MAKLTRLSALESQQVALLIRSAPADQQEAITTQLLNALAKGAIRTSPSRWLKAVIRRTGSHVHPQNAPELSEADYVKRLVQGGISSEDAQRIAHKTYIRRGVSSPVNRRWRPIDHQTTKPPKTAAKGAA